MKIQGPQNPGIPEPPSSESSERAQGGRRFDVSGKGTSASAGVGAPVVAGAHSPDAARPAADVAAPLANAARRIAAEVRAGQIQPGEAIARIVDAALRQVVPARTPDAVRAAVKAELEGLVQRDPLLRSQLQRLGLG